MPCLNGQPGASLTIHNNMASSDLITYKYHFQRGTGLLTLNGMTSSSAEPNYGSVFRFGRVGTMANVKAPGFLHT